MSGLLSFGVVAAMLAPGLAAASEVDGWSIDDFGEHDTLAGTDGWENGYPND